MTDSHGNWLEVGDKLRSTQQASHHSKSMIEVIAIRGNWATMKRLWTSGTFEVDALSLSNSHWVRARREVCV